MRPLKKRLQQIFNSRSTHAVLIAIFFGPLYIYYQSTSVYGGDGGDLVAAAFTRGVAHPPGYPLYTFLSSILISILPYSTVAWRVTLLSSIPGALTLAAAYIIFRKLTGAALPAIISAFSLGFSYLFWLYASVPEVFALHLLLVAILLYLCLRFDETGSLKILALTAFVAGLSLSHHHTIIFLFPGYMYILLKQFRRMKYIKKTVLICLLFLGLGLVPYLYIILAAKNLPIINWENPQTYTGLYRLVTRAIYGSFRSSTTFGLNTQDRLLQLKLVSRILALDLFFPGIVLACLGFFYQMIWGYRKYFVSICLLFFFSGPVFIFYAGFPVHLDFYIATSERFLLVPVMFVFVWIAYGITAINTLLMQMIRRSGARAIFFPVIVFALSLLPFFLFQQNFPRIASLKYDRTAENLARDILASAPDNSILFLSDDTSLFNTQYLYLTTGAKAANRGVKLIQFGLAFQPWYRSTLKKYYPEIILPETTDDAEFLEKLVEANVLNFPVYTNMKFPLSDKYIWLQYGFLQRAISKSALSAIDPETYFQVNRKLFDSYHDPFAGALSVYSHLMLLDVVRVYVNSYRDMGENSLRVKEYPLAEKFLQQALKLDPDDGLGNFRLAEALYFQNRCVEARDRFEAMTRKSGEFVEGYQYLASLYATCLEDKAKANEYLQKYQEGLKRFKTRLPEI